MLEIVVRDGDVAAIEQEYAGTICAIGGGPDIQEGGVGRDFFCVSNSTSGISWDGTDTPWTRYGSVDKLYLQSGQFSSVIKTSRNVNSVDGTPFGLDIDDFNARVPSLAAGGLAWGSLGLLGVGQ